MSAVLRVRRPSGALATFEAEHVDIDSGMCTVRGRWRYASGRLSDSTTYTWPTRAIVEIEWTGAP